MSISRDGNYLLYRTGTDSTIIGTLIGPNNRMVFKPVAEMRYSQERLLEISNLMESMSALRIQREQPDAPTAGTEEANRSRVVSESAGGNNLFRGIVGPDSKPIGSIEDGPVFAPAAGVTFTHQELLLISGDMKRRAEVRS
jgi:hypothetical protein